MARLPTARARRSAAVSVAGVALLAAGLAACGGTSPITASRTPPSIAAPSTVPGTATPTTLPPMTSPTTLPSSPGTTTPGATTPSTSTPINAAAVLHQALSNAHAEGWVTSASADSAGTNAINTIAGPDRGLQTVTVGADTGHIIVVPGATYIHGTASALTTVFAVPSAQAKTLANRWVKLVPSDKEYQTTTEGVTLPSLLAPLAFTGKVQGGTVTSNGTRYDVVTGTIPKGTGYGNGNETGQLAVTTGSHPLPYEFQIATAQGSIEWAYRDWGKTAKVSVPPGAVTLPH